MLWLLQIQEEGGYLHWSWWDRPRSLLCLVLVLFSESQPSYPRTGFVKSQEGENEEGSEGELVVKFGETLPKVIQEQGGFCVRQPALLASGGALARPDQRGWESHGPNAGDAASLSRRRMTPFPAVVKHGPEPSGPNIPK